MKNKLNLVVCLVFTTIFSFAQTSSKSFDLGNNQSIENVVMTWNKNTPEQEMKDDIKALADYGVTIKYSNVKRNDQKETTAIDVSFEDKNGAKGSLSYNSKKPISTIKFYKQDDEVGFGNPSNSFEDAMVFSDFGDNLVLENIDFEVDSVYNPQQKNSMITSKKKTIYQKDGKKRLVIENGEVTEGGDDYTPEELEKIEKGFSSNDEDGEIHVFSDFNLNNQRELERSKKELEKAKKELQETKKEIEKTKSSLKTKKV